MKKFAMILLCVALVFSCTVIAFADPDPATSEYLITINDAKKNEVYTAYKIFDVTHDDGGTAFSYSISEASPWWNIVTTPKDQNDTVDMTQSPFTVDGYRFTKTTHADNNNNYTYLVTIDTTLTTDQQRQAAKDLADKIYAQDLTGMNTAGTAIASDSDTPSAVIDVGGPGYYFVTTSVGSLCGLDTAAKTVTIDEKNDVPEIDKKVKCGTSTTYVDAPSDNPASASIGAPVLFQITVTNGVGCDKNIVVEDTMSDGIQLEDLQNHDITVIVGNSDTPLAPSDSTYELNIDDVNSFTITFLADYVKTLPSNTVITITYTGVMNEDAEISGNTNDDSGDTPAEARNTNTVRMTYSNQVSTDKVYIDLYKVDVVKTDSSSNIIQGAQFQLYDAQTGGTPIELILDGVEYVTDPDTNQPTQEVKSRTYRIAVPGETGAVTTIDAGIAHIYGLGSNTYYLEETQAPDGYNPLDAREPMQVSANNEASLTANDTIWSQNGYNIVNYSGSQLPGTGGIGTYLFYAIGAILVVGAVVVLVSKKRMRAYSELG